MKRLVLFAVVGGGIGAGAMLARSDSSPGSPETSTSNAGTTGSGSLDLKKAAIGGAAAGGLVGLLLDRRAKRKRRQYTKLTGYADKAKPKVESAMEAAFAAAEFALPKVERATEIARERAREKAVEGAKVAREKASAAADVARDKATESAIHARHVAAERADLAKHKAKKSGHPRTAKALDLLPV
jgi:hypothetical protein